VSKEKNGMGEVISEGGGMVGEWEGGARTTGIDGEAVGRGGHVNNMGKGGLGGPYFHEHGGVLG
jgi:hypothetical protein